MRDTLYLAGDVLDRDGLMREHEARRAAGLASRFLDRKELRARFGIARSAALLGYGNLAIDPRKATLAMLNAAVAQNSKIFCPVDIVGIDAKRGHVTATAANGRRIHCRHLVFATGYELPKRRAEQGSQDRLDLGDRDRPAAAPAVAGAMHDLGGVGSLSLSAHHAGWAHRLRRRGRGFLRRGGA